MLLPDTFGSFVQNFIEIGLHDFAWLNHKQTNINLLFFIIVSILV